MITTVRNAALSGTTLVVLLIVSTAITVPLNVVPRTYPTLYMGYMYLIHCIAEPGIAFTILYATNMLSVSDGASWLWLFPCNWFARWTDSKNASPLQQGLLSAVDGADPTKLALSQAVAVPGRQPGMLLRVDTESEMRLSICSNDSNDSYRVADTPEHFMGGYDDYNYGVELSNSGGHTYSSRY